jgi:hypothetical protein
MEDAWWMVDDGPCVGGFWNYVGSVFVAKRGALLTEKMI